MVSPQPPQPREESGLTESPAQPGKSVFVIDADMFHADWGRSYPDDGNSMCTVVGSSGSSLWASIHSTSSLNSRSIR